MSRKIEDLEPAFRDKVTRFLARLDALGIKYVISETRRTPEVQAAYYAQGRKSLDETNRLRKIAGLWAIGAEENKRVITWTLKSRHLEGRAIDITPERAGSFWWSAPPAEWERLAVHAAEFGLDAGHYWPSPKQDSPHYQDA